MRALPEFAWVLLAMALGVLVYSFLRTFLGELLIPSETLSLAVGRTTRSLAAMGTIGILGLLIGGWLAEAHDEDRPAS